MIKRIIGRITIGISFISMVHASHLLPEAESFSHHNRSRQSPPLVYELVPSKLPATALPEVWVLALDGGGIRGIIPAQVLYQLEQELNTALTKRLQQTLSTALGRPWSEAFQITTHLAHGFDLMAGTSTGGIIALGLNAPDPRQPHRPLYTTPTLVNLYKEGERVFPVHNRKGLLGRLWSQKFDASGLEALCTEYFGQSSLQDSISHVLITAYELRQEKLCLFDSAKAQHHTQENFLMADVARSTSAAPTYFEAATIKNKAGDTHLFVDGGIIANNPAMAAYVRAKTLFPQARKINLVSLGTGRAALDNLSDKQQGGLLSWGPSIAGVMMDGVGDLNHHLLQQLAAAGRLDNSFAYLRLQPSLTQKRSEMDIVSNDNIQYLLAIAKGLVRDNAAVLTDIAEQIAVHYDQRGYHLFPGLIAKLQAQLPHKTIDLSGLAINALGAWEIARYFQQQPLHQLETLKLSGNRLQDEGIELLIPIFKQVQSLQVSGNQLSRQAIMAIGRHCPQLTALDISDNPLGKSYPIDTLRALIQGLPQLTSLSADHNAIDAPGGQIILANLPHLQILSLKHATAAPGLIQQLGSHVYLQSLDLAHNQLTDDQTAELCKALVNNTQLRSLSVYYNLLSAQGAYSLAELLRRHQTLESLDVGNNNVGTQGVIALAAALSHHNSLTHFNIARNNIEAAGYEALYQAVQTNSRLKFLGLKRSALENRLRQAFEQLRIKRLHLSIEF